MKLLIFPSEKNTGFDTFLVKSAKKLSFYYKIGIILVKIASQIICISLFYLKWDQFIEYPIGFMINIISIQLSAKIGSALIIRQMVLMIFLSNALLSIQEIYRIFH